MEFTGERLVPEGSDPDLRNEHIARYCFAEPLVAGKRVLDAGCGVGYGAARLALAGGAAVGLDNSAEAVRQACADHQHVPFVVGDCASMPFPAASFDLVVAFEVIEHLARQSDLLSEAARVLAPEGLLVVSTPNRAYYRAAGEEPNPFHHRELDHGEFRAALFAQFAHVEVYLENHSPAVSFTAGSREAGRARFDGTRDADPTHANFFVAICSMQPFESLPDFAYVPDSGNVLRERELHVGKLKEWIGALEGRHAVVEGRMSRELARLPYRILRRLRLAPKLPDSWSD